MTNRKEEQGQAAIEQIKKEAGENAQIEWFPCDMGNLNEIKQVFEDFKKKEDRLDLVRRLTHCPPDIVYTDTGDSLSFPPE